MTTAQKLGSSLVIISMLAAPLMASAATVAHPPPPLPPGAKVGVPATIIASSTPAGAPAEVKQTAPPAPQANPAGMNLTLYEYLGAGIAVLLIAGLFISKRKKGA